MVLCDQLWNITISAPDFAKFTTFSKHLEVKRGLGKCSFNMASISTKCNDAKSVQRDTHWKVMKRYFIPELEIQTPQKGSEEFCRHLSFAQVGKGVQIITNCTVVLMPKGYQTP